MPATLDRYEIAERARAELARRAAESGTRQACEQSLYRFLQEAWPHFEPVPFVGGWHLEAIAEHLEAVSLGEISRLVINVPPRSAKTSATIIAWPTWTWAQPYDPRFPRMGPQVRFLCAAYSGKKAQQDAVTARRLIGSAWYRSNWGDRVRIAADRDNAEQYDTLAGGSRISTGIAESLGKGGLLRVLDDPQKSDEAEPGPTADAVLRAYDEVWSTRSNDPVRGAEVIIMQRLAENDLTGHVLEKAGWVHLMIPAQYEAKRHCCTVLGLPGEKYEWNDPRGCDEGGEALPEDEQEERDGSPFWPERFRIERDEQGNLLAEEEQGIEWCRRQALEVGSHAWASQFQQTPTARGGNVIQSEWWRLWESDYPKLRTVLVSFDGASGLKKMNDYSAATVWGVFVSKGGRTCALLLDAWRMRAPLHEVVKRLVATCLDARVERQPDDQAKRMIPGIGELSIKAAPRWQADYLLIENKGPGMPVAQEIVRLMGSREWITRLVDPEGVDKLARLQRTEVLFENGYVYAPDTAWAQMVIDEVSAFPRSRHDDLTDTVSQCINFLRKFGDALLEREHEAYEADALLFRPEAKPLYDV